MNQPPDPHGPTYRLPAPLPPDPTGWHELRRKARSTLWPPDRPGLGGALRRGDRGGRAVRPRRSRPPSPARLPSPTDWKAVAAILARDARPGDAVALAPPWAERAPGDPPGADPLPPGGGPARSWPRPPTRRPTRTSPASGGSGSSRSPARRGGTGAIPDQLAARSGPVEGPIRVGRLALTRYDLRAPVHPALVPRRAPPRGGGRRGRRPSRARPGRWAGCPRTCVVARFPGPDPKPAVLRFPALPLGAVAARARRARRRRLREPVVGVGPGEGRRRGDGPGGGRGGRAGVEALRDRHLPPPPGPPRDRGRGRPVRPAAPRRLRRPGGPAVSPRRRHRARPGALAVLGFAAATSPAVGISRDESVYVEAGGSYAAFWREALRDPARLLAGRRPSLRVEPRAPRASRRGSSGSAAPCSPTRRGSSGRCRPPGSPPGCWPRSSPCCSRSGGSSWPAPAAACSRRPSSSSCRGTSGTRTPRSSTCR